MNRGHCPGNQRKDTRDVQLTHDVAPGARPRQVIRRTHGEQEYCDRTMAMINERGFRPQPKVAITLRRDEHLSIDIHQPRHCSRISPVALGCRIICAGAPFMWPSSRLVTTERDGYFAICPSPRPNPGEGEVYAREQPLETAA